MFTNFEDVLNIVTCANAIGNFSHCECLAGMFGKEFQSSRLSLNHFAGGLLARLHPWLMIGIDVDERCVKANSPLKQGN